ncbi:MAG: hypothetical protein QM669_01980 [Siphonobacter sp.]
MKTISTPQKNLELIRCLQLIEQKLGWGNSETWSTQDFEQLSESIVRQTGVSLSVTTLKRVWGRVKYESDPTTVTLNTLVQFLGYDNWQQFIVSEFPASTISSTPTPKTIRIMPIAKYGWVTLFLLTGLLGGAAFLLHVHHPASVSSDAFSFSSQPVTTGIPNSVVFHYDASASPTDSVFIQQSWDPQRRQLVPKNGHTYTSIYYDPGYFRAKLIIGNQIVKEHNLLIPSEGWHVVVKQEPVPVYFNATECIHDGILSLPSSAIRQQNIPMQPQPPTVRYRYVRELADLHSDDFIMQTRVKSDYHQGASVCQNIRIMILCKNEYFEIPLSAQGCIGQLSLYLAGHAVSAKNTDLSAFGRDLSKWVEVSCSVQKGAAEIFIDGKKVYETRISGQAQDLVGIGYDFEGTGSVDFVRFAQPNGKLVFEDTFDSHKTKAR